MCTAPDLFGFKIEVVLIAVDPALLSLQTLKDFVQPSNHFR